MPKKVADTIKQPLGVGEAIYNAYWYSLYKETSKFRDQYVMNEANKTGSLYLGLGWYINTTKPDKEIRSITNATAQFWDIITVLAIHYLNKKIDEAGLQDSIKVNATIHDAIYGICKDEPSIIKWLNDNLILTMTHPVFTEMLVPNKANLDIGFSWGEQFEIPNNASLDEIESIVINKLLDEEFKKK